MALRPLAPSCSPVATGTYPPLRSSDRVAGRARGWAEGAEVDDRVIADRYGDVRTRTEALAAPLSGEDQTVQSMPDVSPTKWHRAHTTWFFETFLLSRFLPGYRAHHPDYGYLFNSYYEAVGARHPRARRGTLSRPGIAEITRYRAQV